MSESEFPSEAFLALFRAHAGSGATMTFAEFMALALYAPDTGYYMRPATRVGYGAGSDFFTASTSGPVFGELVSAAAVSLLRGEDPRSFTFVEIGAEPSGGVLKDVAHPFGHARTLRVGEPIELSGRCIVFSNELFDAQPFRRFVFRGGGWRDLGVALRDESLVEIELASDAPPFLPPSAPEGYVIDAPLAAAELARSIAAQPWTGIFLACDYGKPWAELAEFCPAGTARAYYRHTQSNQLLARPGEQDLTCHVCWDWLIDALTQQGFADAQIESQETFFVRHAEACIAKISTSDAAHFSRRKLSLLQLLHPTHLGQKFQVLHARR